MKSLKKETLLNAIAVSVITGAMVIIKEVVDVDATKVIDLNSLVKSATKGELLK